MITNHEKCYIKYMTDEILNKKYKAIVFDRITMYDKDGSNTGVFAPINQKEMKDESHWDEHFKLLNSYKNVRGYFLNPRNKANPKISCTISYLPYKGIVRSNQYILVVFDEPIDHINPFQYFKYIFLNERGRKILNGAILETYEEEPHFELDYDSYYNYSGSGICYSPARKYPLTVEEQINMVNDFLDENPDFFPKVETLEEKEEDDKKKH